MKTISLEGGKYQQDILEWCRNYHARRIPEGFYHMRVTALMNTLLAASEARDVSTIAADLYRVAHYGTLVEFNDLVQSALATRVSEAAPVNLFDDCVASVCAARNGEPAPDETCGHCSGSGWMVRDSDIGTDQECFVCEGTGKFEAAPDTEIAKAQRPLDPGIAQVVDKEFWDLMDSAPKAAPKAAPVAVGDATIDAKEFAALQTYLTEHHADVRPSRPNGLAAWALAALASQAAPIAISDECDVRKILLKVVPGMDGCGHEVYAKNVAEVEQLLSEMGERLDTLELGSQAAPDAPNDTTLAFESALSELIDKIVPGLDSGDILADARRASERLSELTGAKP